MAALIKVDVIVPVHNAESTIEEAVASAMGQVVPTDLQPRLCELLNCAHENGDSATDGEGDDPSCERLIHFDVCVCCYDDASTDGSLAKLRSLKEGGDLQTTWGPYACDDADTISICSTLLIGTAPPGTSSRGAGYARNQAAKLRGQYKRDRTANDESKLEGEECGHFLMLLDSDDVVHRTRIAEQICAMLALPATDRRKTLVGCQFERIPADATEHYAKWANSLSDERLYLEQFRECTLLQPTWCMSREWFEHLGGYLEAPSSETEEMNPSKKVRIEPERNENATEPSKCDESKDAKKEDADAKQLYRLVHPSEISATTATDTATKGKSKRKLNQPGQSEKQIDTLRLAEDTRFFYAHLRAGGRLYLHRSHTPLVSYRHRSGMSQSSSTPRKLLLRLRAKAWEDIVYHGNSSAGNCACWSKGFAVWGAGRDGKDFVKALSPKVAKKVVCFVDVDKKKIEQVKCYDNPVLGLRIPILHFSELARGAAKETFGRIEKKCEDNTFDVASKKAQIDQPDEKSGTPPKPKVNSNPKKKRVDAIDPEVLRQLPVVVCVAMYRTNGALESNVVSIGRAEGVDLWHIV
ncbi:hypothetical protein ACHAXT_013129 [Thalassiosira profunda]